MCVNPISVPNPFYSQKAYRNELGELVELNNRLYSKKKYIDVPCGKCVECRHTYYNSLLQRCLVECRSSYLYFVTLTYDNAHLPSIKIGDHIIYYPDYTHIQDMFKRVRNNNVIDRDFRYICVTEYGDKRCRPHFHLLVFISKKDTDDSVTPFKYESILFNQLKNYYALNVGSRFRPSYEPLFTYNIRQTPYGLRTNYFVKYVDISHGFDNVPEESDTLVKTIRYLIGYINKGSRFDSFVSKLILPYRDSDPLLYQKVSNLLKSRVRYSKGLGFGFINGEKHSLQPISVSTSLNNFVYNQLCDNLPNSFEDFADMYPDFSKEVFDYFSHNTMYLYDDLQEYLKSLDTTKYYCHCAALKYFPQSMSWAIRNHFGKKYLSNPTISYLFNFVTKRPIYKMRRVHSFKYVNDPILSFIRKNLRAGLNNKVPFLTFCIGGSNPQFVPLCSFYKKYCCTSDDVLNMYNSIGCKDYDEWLSIFEKYNKTFQNRADICKYNEYRSALSEDIILNLQSSCLSLSRQSVHSDLLCKIFNIT